MIYRYTLLVSFCFAFLSLKANLNNPLNSNCDNAQQLCKDSYSQSYQSVACATTPVKLYYYFRTSYTAGLSLGTFTTTHASTYRIYGAFYSQGAACRNLNAFPESNIVKYSSSALTTHDFNFAYIPDMVYILEVTVPPPSCGGNISFSTRLGANCGDESSYPLPENNNCSAALQLCNTSLNQNFNITGCGGTETKLFYYFKTSSNPSLTLGTFTTNYSSGYKIYGPYADLAAGCTAQNNLPAPSAVKSSAGNATTHNFTFSYITGSTYLLVVTLPPPACNGTIAFSGRQGASCGSGLDCTDCLKGFQPGPGKYIVSAWVKEEGASDTLTSYTKPSIRISLLPSGSFGPFVPSGQIIDGWQQIEGIFTMTATNVTSFTLELRCSIGSALFDDVRIFPFDASMMSYVYDPVTLRLVAELDERNYAKLYEYDEEGKLVRIKKETEKGIMTIQENRENSVK